MKQKIILPLMIIIAVLTGAFSVAYANSNMPPSYTLYSYNCPADTAIYQCFRDGSEETVVSDWGSERRLNESIFWIDIGNDAEKLHIVSSEKDFYVEFPETLQYYEFLTLDFEKEKLLTDIPPWRKPLLITSRVVLTLLIECFVYFLAKYRKKSSYIKIMIINLITQGFLNIVISGESLSYHSYAALYFLLTEAVVFAVEMIAVPIAVKERRDVAVESAFFANVASLVIGGLILAGLPY